MTKVDCPHPADLVNETREECGRCDPHRPIGFTAEEEIRETYKTKPILGYGYGHSTVSHMEAVAMAVMRAQEHLDQQKAALDLLVVY